MAVGSYTSGPTLKVWNVHRDWGRGPVEDEMFAIFVYWSYAADVENNLYSVRIDKVRFQESTFLCLGGQTAYIKGGFASNNLVSGSVYIDQSFGPPWYGDVTINLAKTFSNDSDGNPQNVKLGWAVKVTGEDRDAPRYTSLQYVDVTSYIPKMARGSKMTLPSGGFSIGKAGTVNITKCNSSYTEKLYYSIDGTNWTMPYSGTATSTTVTFNENFAATNMKNTASKNVTFKLETYSGSTLIGTQTASTTINVPASYKPSIASAFTVSDTNSTTAALNVFVQTYSSLRLNATNTSVSTSLSSPIVSYKAYMKDPNGKWWEKGTSGSTVIDMGVVKNKGKLSVKLVVTDARGRTGEREQEITVMAYTPPKLEFTADRCSYDSENTEYVADSSGENIWFTAKVNCSQLNGNNSLTLQITYGGKTGSTINWIGSYYDYPTSVLYGMAFENHVIDDGGTAHTFSKDTTYMLKALLSDALTSTYTIIEVPSSSTLLNFGADGNSIGFGGLSDNRGTLQFYNQIEIYAPRTGYSISDGGNTKGYLKVVSLEISKVAGKAANSPISITFRQKLHKKPTTLTFCLHNYTDFRDGGMVSSYYVGPKNLNIYLREYGVQAGSTTVDIYVEKSGNYDIIQIEDIVYNRNALGLKATHPYEYFETLPFNYSGDVDYVRKAVREFFGASGSTDESYIYPDTKLDSGRYQGDGLTWTVPYSGWYWISGAFGGNSDIGTASGESRFYVKNDSNTPANLATHTIYNMANSSSCRAMGIVYLEQDTTVYFTCDVPVSGLKIKQRLDWTLIYYDI